MRDLGLVDILHHPLACEGLRIVNEGRTCPDIYSGLILVVPGHSLRPEKDSQCSAESSSPMGLIHICEQCRGRTNIKIGAEAGGPAGEQKEQRGRAGWG